MTALGRCLVVGGTGMLTEATRWIAGHADAVTLVARSPGALADALGANGVALDWADASAAAIVAELPGDFDTALIWVHDAGRDLVRPLEDRLVPGGRSVRVHGSESANLATLQFRDPDPRPDIHRQIVVLGYHPTPEGKRWLSNAEISAGTIAALRDPVLHALTIGGASG